MSDSSQGEGWWQASDGKWYPPEAQPGQPAATPQTPGGPNSADPKPSLWRRFRNQALWKQIVAWAVAAIVAIVVIAVAAGGGSSPNNRNTLDATGPTTSTTEATTTTTEATTTTAALTMAEWGDKYRQPLGIMIGTAHGLVSAISAGNQVRVDASCSALRDNYRTFLSPVTDPPDPAAATQLDHAKNAIFEASRSCRSGVFSSSNLHEAAQLATIGANLLDQVARAAGV